MRNTLLRLLATILTTSCTALEPGNQVVRDGGGPMDTGLDAGPATCPELAARPQEVVAGVLTGDHHWDCFHTYVVTDDLAIADGDLLIDPGVHVLVEDGKFILIAKSATIHADGSPVPGSEPQPIVFAPRTASNPRNDQWRGLYILGEAPTSAASAQVGVSISGATSEFGGPVAEDDCGVLRYVRVEYAGAANSLVDRPTAGLTLAGCGRSTVVDYVQVHRGVEGLGIIGGSVPVKHIVVTAPERDGISWAAGYTGLIQYAFVQIVGRGNALRGANNSLSELAPPVSRPLVYNATLVGDPAALGTNQTGFSLSYGGGGSLRNSLVYGFDFAWVNVETTSTAAQFTAVPPSASIENSFFVAFDNGSESGFPAVGENDGEQETADGGFDESATFGCQKFGNVCWGTLLTLADPYSREAPRAYPSTNDVTVPPGREPPSEWTDIFENDGLLFTGAFPAISNDAERPQRDWTLGWTAYPAP